MALSKSVTTDSAAVATYHNIAEVLWQKGVHEAQVVVYSYLNAAARVAHAKPLQVSGATFPDQADAPTLAAAYELLKADPNWSDAVDA